MSPEESFKNEGSRREYEPIRKYYHVIEAVTWGPLTDLDYMYSEMRVGGVTYTDAMVQIDPYSSTTNSMPEVNEEFFLDTQRGVGVSLRNKYSAYERILGSVWTEELEPEISLAEEQIKDLLRKGALASRGQEEEREKIKDIYESLRWQEDNPFYLYRQTILRLYQAIEERIDPDDVIDFSEQSIEQIQKIIDGLKEGSKEPRRHTLENEIEMHERRKDGYFAAIERNRRRKSRIEEED